MLAIPRFLAQCSNRQNCAASVGVRKGTASADICDWPARPDGRGGAGGVTGAYGFWRKIWSLEMSSGLGLRPRELLVREIAPLMGATGGKAATVTGR